MSPSSALIFLMIALLTFAQYHSYDHLLCRPMFDLIRSLLYNSAPLPSINAIIERGYYLSDYEACRSSNDGDGGNPVRIRHVPAWCFIFLTLESRFADVMPCR